MVVIDTLPDFVLKKEETPIPKTKKKGSIFDPGTINSDDDVENYSDEEEWDLVEMKKSDDFMSISKSWGKVDETSKLDIEQESSDVRQVNYKATLKKYANLKRKSFDIQGTISRIRNEEVEKKKVKKITKLECGEGITDSDISSDDDNFITPSMEKEKEDLIVDKVTETKIKEAKRIRVEKVQEQRIAREDELFNFTTKTVNEVNISFQEMNLSPQLMKAMQEMKYSTPTPIQAETIPNALLGKDICGCAATGTGKTAAYMLPILERLIHRSSEDVTRVLVMVPTRELGVQVYEVSQNLAKFTNIRVTLSVGGLSHEMQSAELKTNPDIIIATPGRLLDHLAHTPSFHLKEIEILVLDEADKMLDEYFLGQMKEIIKNCCVARQTLLFSATMTDEVKDLAVLSLNKPLRIFVNNNTDVAQNLKQEFVKLHNDTYEQRRTILAALICRNFKKNCMVFAGTKIECHNVFILLCLLGVKAGELHGNLHQMERLEALEKFRRKETDVLVATDVAARGLDIVGVETVINYCLPPTYQYYVHRVGRTARAGFAGRSVTLAFTKGKDFTMIRTIRKHSLTPMYNRIIAPEVIKKYEIKLENLKDAMKKILEEEKKTKALGDALNSIKRIKNKIRDPRAIINKPRMAIHMSLSSVSDLKKERRLIKLQLAGLTKGSLSEGLIKRLCSGKASLLDMKQEKTRMLKKGGGFQKGVKLQKDKVKQEEQKNLIKERQKGSAIGKLHKRQLKRGEFLENTSSSDRQPHSCRFRS